MRLIRQVQTAMNINLNSIIVARLDPDKVTAGGVIPIFDHFSIEKSVRCKIQVDIVSPIRFFQVKLHDVFVLVVFVLIDASPTARLMAGEFQHGIFNCFDNCFLCVVTYACPCYTAGKVAETLGESCCLHALLYLFPVVDLVCRTYVRVQVRERRNIDGSVLGDLCVNCFCAVPALVQEAQEMNAMGGRSASVEQDIRRE